MVWCKGVCAKSVSGGIRVSSFTTTPSSQNDEPTRDTRTMPGYATRPKKAPRPKPREPRGVAARSRGCVSAASGAGYHGRGIGRTSAPSCVAGVAREMPAFLQRLLAAESRRREDLRRRPPRMSLRGRSWKRRTAPRRQYTRSPQSVTVILRFCTLEAIDSDESVRLLLHDMLPFLAHE
ncbi:uncharacterized protein LOC143517278 isoform X2 [Brachyhypopomus gauderio]|uniref:uncharacterized protein LOC143517278 isoform X2 n=1 Tax=Brachyhypopomus gauderio TaxID=698409 RepID=UPI004042FEF3